MPFIFPFKKSSQAKSRTSRNSNKEQMNTEDDASASASATEEQMNSCDCELGDTMREVVSQQHSCGCQECIPVVVRNAFLW